MSKLRGYEENVQKLLQFKHELRNSRDIESKIMEFEKDEGSRIKKGYKAAIKGAVKKYKFVPSNKEVWIVVGKEREYVVIPAIFCSCEDFYLNVVIRNKVNGCYHIYAQIIADVLNKFDEITADDGSYFKFIKEWRRV